ncbi:MAG: hypothetical protein M3R38_07805 [Actinomycetota bacterium]|nr:hypothetical protein [Actinomycetota bacterium]MDP9484554.1 hypothetical protein [Actinomycetota bacterium]
MTSSRRGQEAARGEQGRGPENVHERRDEAPGARGRPGARTLLGVVPIAERKAAAGATVALTALEVHEGGVGMLRYLISHDLKPERGEMVHAEPEVRVRDDSGLDYEVALVEAGSDTGGEADGLLRVEGLLEPGTRRLEVEFVRLLVVELPDGEEKPSVLGPWLFRVAP